VAKLAPFLMKQRLHVIKQEWLSSKLLSQFQGRCNKHIPKTHRRMPLQDWGFDGRMQPSEVLNLLQQRKKICNMVNLF